MEGTGCSVALVFPLRLPRPDSQPDGRFAEMTRDVSAVLCTQLKLIFMVFLQTFANNQLGNGAVASHSNSAQTRAHWSLLSHI